MVWSLFVLGNYVSQIPEAPFDDLTETTASVKLGVKKRPLGAGALK